MNAGLDFGDRTGFRCCVLESENRSPQAPRLARRLTLPTLVLYGVGVTVGAGIYVLIGAVVGKAGAAAPWSFLLSAIVVGFSALSFAEWVVRRPESAGEAAYVATGLDAERAGLMIGLTVAAIGIVAAATVSVGTGGYLSALTGWPVTVSAIGIAAAMTVVAIIGIRLTAGFAAVIAVIEVTALIAVALAALFADPSTLDRAVDTLIPPAPALAPLVLAGALIAFFAFIGFEDLVNLAEEVVEPERTVPRAIFWTLGITTLLYVAVVSIAIGVVGVSDLADHPAPIALVAERAGTIPKEILAAIAVLAGINGILIQIVMASRVLYGLARRGGLPAWLSAVHPATRTPVHATLGVAVIVLAGIVLMPLDRLAALTSALTLIVFTMVNLALLLEKEKRGTPETLAFSVPVIVPVLGAVSAIGLLLAGMAAAYAS